MRFAISAVAAMSGLVLLGLAFYGQPAVYLRQAGEQWDALMDRPPGDQRVDEGDGDGERAARLQAEVARLEAELAARQAPQRQADTSSRGFGTPTMIIPEQRDAPAESARGTSEQARNEQARTEQAKAEQARTEQARTEQAKAEQAEQARTEQAKAEQARVEQAKAEQARTEQAKAEQARVEQAKAEQARAEQAKAEQARAEQAKAQQARVEQAKAEQARTEQAKAEQARAEQARVEKGRADQARAEQAKAQQAARTEQAKAEPANPPKAAVVQRPLPAPPPPPSSSPPRQEADDAQSVLARLRQSSPGQRGDTTATAETRPAPVASPSLPRLNAARSALASGRIEDARRLLQEAQLQLVFGPAGDNVPSAGRGAADVARALDALSANDIPLGRRFVDIAMGDLSGNPMNLTAQEAGRRASGYAPAYPPR
jgi:uncharacterized protein YjbI with pentapeptide repeats